MTETRDVKRKRIADRGQAIIDAIYKTDYVDNIMQENLPNDDDGTENHSWINGAMEFMEENLDFRSSAQRRG